MKKNAIKYISLFFSSMAILVMLFDIGFDQKGKWLPIIHNAYWVLLIGIIVGIPLKYIFRFKDYSKLRIWLSELVLWLFYNYLLVTVPFSKLSVNISDFTHPKVLLAIGFTLSFIREISTLKLNWKYKRTNPATLFVLSFILLILTGGLLLMLPNATYTGIKFIDALFTSTSAVCVTGLIVVDTGTFFTPFGQTIIMVLIQLGGIGIMTFTSFFAFFFVGGASYQNLILLGSLSNENKISEIMGTLKKIIFFTFLVEGIGVMLIYWNLQYTSMYTHSNDLFFAVFHTISAFCNAGFSTLSNSFYDIGFRFNYSLHLVIALLFIIGGLGFPVIINLYSWFKHFMINRALRLNKKREVLHKAHVISLNTKIVFYTTLFLLLTGTVLFLIAENNNTLSEHHGLGKVLTAFFAAATPRTAGFNTIDTALIGLPAMFILIFLMWVGASPASTGGGIKTSTFTLAILNAISIAKGKKKLELNSREIPEVSIRRSFAFVFLSLLAIGIITFLLFITESEKTAVDLLFEVVSAFSTVGLSRGITGDLSGIGKYLIIATMFVGRIGALTFLTSLLKQTKEKLYQYPTENILIN